MEVLSGSVIPTNQGTGAAAEVSEAATEARPVNKLQNSIYRHRSLGTLS